MKKKILSLGICVSLALCACGGSSNATSATNGTTTVAETTTAETTAAAETTTAAETKTAETETTAEEKEPIAAEGFNEQGKVLLDNDIAKVTLEDETEDSYYVGYNIVIENKSDMNILLGIDNGSVDGLMTYIDVQGGSVAPKKKSKAEMRFYTSDSDIKSLDDLKNVEGAFTISTNTDGGSSYTREKETYPFELVGRVGGASASEEKTEGQILLDNEQITIALTGTVEDSYYVGYSLTLDNKSDEYILVGIDNGSVDGFMTYIDVQGGSVAPKKKSKAEMRFYTKDGDIKSLDDLKNVEGAFTISTNTDGGSSYTRSKETYPFTVGDASNASAANNDVSEKANANSEAAATAETKENSENIIVLGETISSDDWDFTVNNVEFTYELKPRNTSSVYTSYTAPDEKVYIHIDAEYHNKSKKDVCIRDLPVPNANYNDGYKYEGFVLADRDDNSFFWVSSYVVAEPLTTCHYHGLIECPKVVDESEEPLYVTMKLPNKQVYRYDIRK